MTATPRVAEPGAEPSPAPVAAALVLFVLAWWVFGVFSHHGKVLNDDLTEAYAWGREFRLGYNQHPPFWAWVAGLWFLVFPHRDWAFELLALVNAAIGLWGAWRLLGRFASGATRQAAWLLLLCTPLYTFKAYKYNANAIFLSLWPWTLYAFLRALETRRPRDSAVFGAMVGLCFLSKYYAITLVLTCLVASVLRRDGRAYWRSAGPWIAMGVAALLVAPHAVWAVVSGAPPVKYALSLTGNSPATTLFKDFNYLGEIVALQLAMPVLALLARGRARALVVEGELRFLGVLVGLPVLLTMAFGLALGVRINAEMTLGIFPLLPILVMRLVPLVDPVRLRRLALVLVVGGTGIAVAVSPFLVCLLKSPTDPSWSLPQREAVKATASVWEQATGAKLRFVGGSKYYTNTITFYNRDHPSSFLYLDYERSPWVTPEALRRDGLLIVCDRQDLECHQRADELAGADAVRRTLQLEHRICGAVVGRAELDVVVLPPGRSGSGGPRSPLPSPASGRGS